jgi:alpha-L-fucosidase
VISIVIECSRGAKNICGVSKNGNLLLDVGPEADGTILQIQLDRLKALGAWLKQNGEGIYGTQPWTRAEGKTQDLDVRFTRKGAAVYAVLMGMPGGGSVTLKDLSLPTATAIACWPTKVR